MLTGRRAFQKPTGAETMTAILQADPLELSSSPGADLQTGELAVSLGHSFEGWMGRGTLARAPLLGGGARPVLEGVREADFSPDGSQLAIVRRVDGRERLELPAGRVLYETAGYISHMRVSPRGDRIAFADHALWADNVGTIAVVDLSGAKKTLTNIWAGGVSGLAWPPSGEEVWFTATPDDSNLAVRAVDLAGRQRVLLAGLTDLFLFDVSREGRLLLGRAIQPRTVEALPAGRATPEDLSLRASTTARFMSSDGRVILFSDQSASPYTAYLQHADGSSPVRVGQGDAYSLSPDGRWVVGVTSDAPPRILLHPTGPGESREVPNGRHILVDALGWMPDGKRLVAFGSTQSERSRGFVLDAKDGAARPFTDEGVSVPWSAPVVSPDGSRVVGEDAEGHSRLYSVDGGPSEPVPGLAGGDRVFQWAEDGRGLFVGRRAGPAWRIRRLDLQTGREAPWIEITPGETAGLRLSWVYLTPNGRFWVQSYSRLLTDLYVAEGLR